MDADLAKPLVPSTARLNILRKLCSNTSLSKHESSLLKAVAVIGLGGIVVGYNVGLVAGGFLKEGSLNFTISATVQDLIVAILYVGSAIGSLFAGPLADSIGRWKTARLQAVLFVLGSLFIGFSQTSLFIIFGRLINGVAIAFAVVSSLPYLTEISPLKYSGRFQGTFEIFIAIGLLLSTVMNFLASDQQVSWVGLEPWRWTHVFPAFFAALQFVLLYLLPESPQFLVQKGLNEDAMSALEQIYCDPDIVRVEFANLKIINMSKTSGVFRTFLVTVTLYSPSFIVILGLVIFQACCGGYVFESYAPLIYETIGYSDFESLMFTLFLGILRLTVTLAIMFYVDSSKAGRKQLLTYGTVILLVGNILFPVACRFYPDNMSFTFAASAIIVLGYSMGFGIVIQLLQSEMFPTLIRSRSLAISMILLDSSKSAVLYFFPIVQSHQANHNHEDIFFIFAACSFLALIYIRMFVPETLRKTALQTLGIISTNFKNKKYLEWRSFCYSEELDSEVIADDLAMNNQINRGLSNVEKDLGNRSTASSSRDPSYYSSSRETGSTSASLKSIPHVGSLSIGNSADYDEMIG